MNPCPHIGPSGFCQRTDCLNSINGTCRWLNDNSTVTTTDNTADADPAIRALPRAGGGEGRG